MSSDEYASTAQQFPYDNADRSLLMAHIQKHFGIVTGIGQAQLSTGTPVNILALTPPSRKHLGKLFAQEKNIATGDETILLTLGAGAHVMNVPKDSELPPRIEYLMRLPADWNVQSENENDAWPVRLLLNIASLPEEEQGYTSAGQTFSFSGGMPFADDTLLCSAVLIGMNDREGQCRLNDGEAVTFYEVIPLYAEELEFTATHGPVALIDEFIRYAVPRVIMRNRPNVAVLFEHRPSLMDAFRAMDKKSIQKLSEDLDALSLEERVALRELLSENRGVVRHTAMKLRAAAHALFRRTKI